MVWQMDSDRPIYAQLIEQIKLRIMTGVYPAGSRLPSVRDIAAEASVNPNTMQRALAELERENLVQTARTSGRFITDDEGMIRKMKESMAKEMVNAFFEKMSSLGYAKDETLAIIETAAKEME